LDFRVETNGNANRLFVNGGDNTVLFGTQTTQAPGGDSYAVQIFGTSLAEAGLTIMRGSDDSGFPALVFCKSRNTTPGSFTIVQDADILGRIDWYADDGTNINTPAARILAAIDETPGENDMPTKLSFYTTANGASDVTERMRLDSNGYLRCQGAYDYTTAQSANVYVNSSGLFKRNTSALKYKKDVRDLESVDINTFRPVRYKSKIETDDQAEEHFGFIADEFHEAGLTELVTYSDASYAEDDTEKENPIYEVEGFNYNRLTVVLTKALQDANKKIETLETKVTALENA